MPANHWCRFVFATAPKSNLPTALLTAPAVASTIVGVDDGRRLLPATMALGQASACSRFVTEPDRPRPQVDVQSRRFLSAFGRGVVAGGVTAMAQTAAVGP